MAHLNDRMIDRANESLYYIMDEVVQALVDDGKADLADEIATSISGIEATLAGLSAEPKRWVDPGTEQLVVIALAAAFTQHLHAWLTDTELRIVRARNRAQTDPRICHSHDFCDANMAMDGAWVALFGESVDADDEEQAERWSAAWDLAKRWEFRLPETVARSADPDVVTELRNARNIIARAIVNGAWGEDSTDEEDSHDEVAGWLTSIDHVLSRQ